MNNKLISLFVIVLIGLMIPVQAIDVNDWKEGDIYLTVGAIAKSSDTVGGITIAGSLTPQAETIIVSGKNLETGLNEPITVCLDNSDLSFLEEYVSIHEDGKYKMEEQICLENIVVGTSIEYSNEFGDEAYMVVQSRGLIKYVLDMDKDLEYKDITDEEPLNIKFFGRNMKITSFDDNELTYLTGQEYYMKVGDKITSEEKTVTLVNVGLNSVVVKVENSLPETIQRGTTEMVNGLEIYVKDLFYRIQIEASSAGLVIGSNVEDTIENMDEVENYEDYRWIVSEGQIGVKHYEILRKVEDVIEAGDSIALPEDFAFITYVGLNDVEYTNLDFRIEIIDTITYLIIEGNFDDHSEIYFDGTTAWNRDLDEEITLPLEIEYTDSFLELINESLWINDIEIIGNLDSVLVNSVNVGLRGEDVRSSYGIKAIEPEDGLSEDLENRELTISVPSEMIEARININNEKTTSTSVGGEALNIRGILDSDLSSSFTRIISIGGPVVNTLTKKHVGEWSYAPYESIVELFKDDETNQLILVVAGTNAEDTTLAANLLSDYFKGKNSYFDDGTSFKITATSMNDITVEPAGNGNTEED